MKPKRLILCDFPNNKCNLRCEYCYLTQIPQDLRVGEKFKYSIEHIAKSLSAKRLGGPCIINMTGAGETMLQPQLVDLCRLLLEQGHFIELVTNFTVTNIVDQFMEFPTNLQEQMEFKISFHYSELKRLNWLNSFFENVDKVQKSNFSFALELMPNDSLVPEIDNIIGLCHEKVGAKCQVTVGRAEYKPSMSLLSDYDKGEFKKIWSKFDSTMFNFKMGLLDVKRKEFCYAGDWTLRVDLYSGEASPCYSQPFKQNIFDDPSKPINFVPVGCHCAMPYCINGHAHMCLGVIPEYKSPTYTEIRNRVRADGTEWFSPRCKKFFSYKLYESNEEYSSWKKFITNTGWYFRSAMFLIKYPDKVLRRLKLKKYKSKNDGKN